jgi:histidinol dehydrogenase
VRVSEHGPEATATQLRALCPTPDDVEAEVRAIIDEVRRGGDRALLALTERFDRARLNPGGSRAAQADLAAAQAALEPEVLDALRTAIANVTRVVQAQLHDPVAVELAQGQHVEIVEVPVRRAAAYVPAGRAPYLSTVVMIAVTARVAGVEQVDPVILGACSLCGVTEVYRVGGAQAVAALAYGTETIPAVEVIAGPGSPWVQEAKRQIFGTVGIDGIAGPSELVVVADAGQDAELIALDLLAQGEHGDGSLTALLCTDPALLAEVGRRVAQLAPQRPSVAGAALALVRVRSARAGLGLAEAIAPEHLELVGPEAEALAGEIRAAGCVFVGADAATAFGDYVAGSNHVLPTGGAARFQSALSAATFRRRMARVSFAPGAAARLAPAGAALARAEGFPVHAESMERRA